MHHFTPSTLAYLFTFLFGLYFVFYTEIQYQTTVFTLFIHMHIVILVGLYQVVWHIVDLSNSTYSYNFN